MDTKHFSKNMKKLDKRFKGGKSLAKETLEVYFETVQEIPNDPWDEIIDKVVKYNKGYPTPGELSDMWIEWRNRHPKQIVRDGEKTDCGECGGNGWIEYWKKEKGSGQKYLHIAGCAKCDNCEIPKGVAVTTKANLRRLGYEIKGEDRPTLTEPVMDGGKLAKKDVRKLAESVVNVMDDEIPF